jgi:serine/threonine-protein kinase RIO1
MGSVKPLFTVEGYFDEFYRILGDHATHKEAYVSLEHRIEREYNIEMYKCYETFKKGKAKYLHGKARRMNKKPTPIN